MRERLAALNACGPLYRIHVDIRIDQVGVGGARIKLFVVVYARGGALVAEIPTTVSGNRFSPDDLAATNELLVAAAEHAAFAFSDHYH